MHSKDVKVYYFQLSGSAHANVWVNQIRSLANNDLLQILSYHIHCLFVKSYSDQVKNAMMLYYGFQNQIIFAISINSKEIIDQLCLVYVN